MGRHLGTHLPGEIDSPRASQFLEMVEDSLVGCLSYTNPPIQSPGVRQVDRRSYIQGPSPPAWLFPKPGARWRQLCAPEPTEIIQTSYWWTCLLASPVPSCRSHSKGSYSPRTPSPSWPTQHLPVWHVLSWELWVTNHPFDDSRLLICWPPYAWIIKSSFQNRNYRDWCLYHAMIPSRRCTVYLYSKFKEK